MMFPKVTLIAFAASIDASLPLKKLDAMIADLADAAALKKFAEDFESVLAGSETHALNQLDKAITLAADLNRVRAEAGTKVKLDASEKENFKALEGRFKKLNDPSIQDEIDALRAKRNQHAEFESLVADIDQEAHKVPAEFAAVLRARFTHAELDFWRSEIRAKVTAAFTELTVLRFILTQQEKFKSAMKAGRDALNASGIPETAPTYQKLLNALRAARAAYWTATTVKDAEGALTDIEGELLSKCHEAPATHAALAEHLQGVGETAKPVSKRGAVLQEAIEETEQLLPRIRLLNDELKEVTWRSNLSKVLSESLAHFETAATIKLKASAGLHLQRVFEWAQYELFMRLPLAVHSQLDFNPQTKLSAMQGLLAKSKQILDNLLSRNLGPAGVIKDAREMVPALDALVKSAEFLALPEPLRQATKKATDDYLDPLLVQTIDGRLRHFRIGFKTRELDSSQFTVCSQFIFSDLDANRIGIDMTTRLHAAVRVKIASALVKLHRLTSTTDGKDPTVGEAVLKACELVSRTIDWQTYEEAREVLDALTRQLEQLEELLANYGSKD